MKITSTRNCLRSLVLAAAFVLSMAMVGNAVLAGDVPEDCSECDLSSQNFDNQDLSYVNFFGADLYRASMRMADLNHANLQNANVAWTTLSGADLSNAVLVGADLTGANLAMANTTGVIVDDTTVTDETTTCPDGTPGPCTFSAE